MKPLYGLCLLAFNAVAVEQEIKGVVDVRATHVNGINSFLDEGLGKFRFKPDTRLSLAQLGVNYQLEFNEHWATKIVANAYLDGVSDGLGITESYIQYKGLPTSSGLRVDAKLGIMYPNITLENQATAWTSPYTLTFSSINAWLAEEVRQLGGQLSISKLGKFNNSLHDVKLTAEVFGFNDTTGALLAWHGWTIGSTQTPWHKTIATPDTPALSPIGALAGQAERSDPFTELDNRAGFHLSGEWHLRGRGKVLAGYYDNNADTRVVKNGQYAWRTRFSHLGLKWRLPYKISLVAQMLVGDTLMMGPNGEDAVNNDYRSANMLLSKSLGKHRVSTRVERFSVTDNDATPLDDNNERGHALTLAYRYQLSKGWFLHSEYSWLKSHRATHKYFNVNNKLIERQFQVGTRIYF